MPWVEAGAGQSPESPATLSRVPAVGTSPPGMLLVSHLACWWQRPRPRQAEGRVGQMTTQHEAGGSQPLWNLAFPICPSAGPRSICQGPIWRLGAWGQGLEGPGGGSQRNRGRAVDQAVGGQHCPRWGQVLLGTALHATTLSGSL